MAGCFGVSDEQLLNIRKSIQKDIKAFQKIISGKNLVSKFGSIQGEENKRIPKEFQEAFEKEPLIAKKQFYIVARRESDLITSENLLAELIAYWHTAKPLNDYLKNAIQ